MGEDKEDYEVGIPLDDLAGSTEPIETESDETEIGAADANSENLEEDEGVGLPSLFDEDELAEVGLKAAPFDDAENSDVEGPGPPSDIRSAQEQDIAADEPSEGVADDTSFNDDMDGPESIAELKPVLDDSMPTQEDVLATDVQGDEPPDGYVDPLIDQPQSAALQSEIAMIYNQLADLKAEFVGKLKYDAHKDKIIDKLHQELQEYKQDIVKKHILSIVLDVVKVADDIRKWLTYFRSLDVSQRDPVKLFRYLEAIPSDLEDIFYWQGVRPYTSKDGEFNPAKQRAIKKIPTDEPSKDKTIAKSLRPGYEWEDKVIRQEMVAVYVHEDESESVDTRNIDE